MDPDATASPLPVEHDEPSIPRTSFIHGTTVEDDDQSISHHSSHGEEEAFEDEISHSTVEREESTPLPHAHSHDEEHHQHHHSERSGSSDHHRHHSLSSRKHRHSKKKQSSNTTQQSSSVVMTEADVGIFQRLDAEYDRAMEEREVAYAARYNSVRQSACFAVSFMAIYITLGTIYFMRQADWTLEESLFFGIYTITTVGYGNLDNPETPAFQIYTIFFILIGIATLTIMVAQVYQCIALEAGRAQHSRDQTEMMRRGLDIMASQNNQNNGGDGSDHSNGGRSGGQRLQETLNAHFPVPLVDRFLRCFDRIKHFLMHNECGRGLSVLLPFLGLILIGATVVGGLEGWTPIESIYFAVVSLTTVGFGDYFPTQSSSRIFCILWLPFSVGFMSLYLGNIAAFYIRLSDRNIARIERHLRRKMDGLKSRAEREREVVRQRALRGQGSTTPSGLPSGRSSPEAAGRSGFNAVPTGEGSSDSLGTTPDPLRRRSRSSTGGDQERRTRVLQNHLNQRMTEGEGDSASSMDSTMSTMMDVLRAVHSGMKNKQSFATGPESEFLQYRSSKLVSKSTLTKGGGSVRKPSFALRVLVQERFAEIIATEVAGFQNDIQISECTLSVTIESLKSTSEKWLIPRRARRAFRAVAFESLYFVGEHGLITRGAEALYDLNPFEFHGLFAPLLAALGDAETMEGWLASTEILAEYDLRRGASKRPSSDSQGAGADATGSSSRVDDSPPGADTTDPMII